MVTEPTRLDNVLDLFLTSNHTLVQKVEIYLGIADHDVMVADVNIKPTLGRQEPRSVSLYRKANWDCYREYISAFASDLIRNCPNKTNSRRNVEFFQICYRSRHVPTTRPGCRYLSLYRDFQTCLDDFGLVQMVSKPTRGDIILDLFLTSNHTLLNTVQNLPGLSDHDIIIANVSVTPKMKRQKPRSVPLFRKANWDGYKSFMREKSLYILANFQESTVEEIWHALKTALNSGMETYIPSKNIRAKCSLPWITQEIRRLIRKRDKLYQKQKSGTARDRYHFKQVKHLIQSKTKHAHNNYLADILGVGSAGEGRDIGFSTTKKQNKTVLTYQKQ